MVSKPLAVEAAEYLKRKHPNSAVMVKDLQSGEMTAVAYKPDFGPDHGPQKPARAAARTKPR